MGNEKMSTIQRRLTRGAAMAGVAVVAVMGLSAGSAQAETTTQADERAGGCRSGYVCAWEDKNYGGDKWVNWKVGSVGTVYDVDGWDGDNELSSISNESSKTLRLYKTDDATGFSWCIGPGQDIKNLSDLGPGQPDYNDWIQSMKVVSSC